MNKLRLFIMPLHQTFLPHDAILVRYYAVALYLPVKLSHCFIITQTALHGNRGDCQFSTAKDLVTDHVSTGGNAIAYVRPFLSTLSID